MSTKDAWDLFETKKDRKRRKRLQMYGLFDDDDIVAKRSRAARLGSAVSSSAAMTARLIGSAGGAAFRAAEYSAHLIGRSAAAISATGVPEKFGKFAKKSSIALFNEIARRSGPTLSAAAAYIKLPKEASSAAVPVAIKMKRSEMSQENAAQMYNAAVPVLLTAFAAASSHGHILNYNDNEYDRDEDDEKNNMRSILGID